MESSIIDLDEHHTWKEQTWLVRSSLVLPSKIGMFEGIIVSIEGQPALWCMGSFINWPKSGRLNPTIKGSMGAIEIVSHTVPLNVTTDIKMEPTPGWVPTPAVGPDMVTICGGGLELDQELDEPGEE